MNKEDYNLIEDLLYESGLTAQGCWDELDSYAKTAVYKFASLLLEKTKETNHEGMKNGSGTTTETI